MQSRKMSLVEAIVSNVASFLISTAVQWLTFPWFGIHVSVLTNMVIVLMFMGLSVIRTYFIRRIFNWLG